MDAQVWLALALVAVFGMMVRALVAAGDSDPEPISGVELPREFRAWFWDEFGEIADGRRVRSLGVVEPSRLPFPDATGLGESWLVRIDDGSLVFLEIRGRRCARIPATIANRFAPEIERAVGGAR